MACNAYHFEDHWDVPFRIEDVWEVLAHPLQFPVWWKGVYLSAEAVNGGGPKPKVGTRVACVARGRLPYKLRFTIETTALEKPHLIGFKASGDFDTLDSRWILKEKGSGTHVILDWNPVVEKPLVKALSPVLKPLFRWNHQWTMVRGERQIAEYMARQSH